MIKGFCKGSVPESTDLDPWNSCSVPWQWKHIFPVWIQTVHMNIFLLNFTGADTPISSSGPAHTTGGRDVTT